MPYTLSHRLNPVIREYRRTSSAAIDASLKPLMQAHLTEMDQDLRAAGFDGELLVVTSFGGVLRVADVAGRPIYSVNSGPAMAPLAGRVAAANEPNVVVCDTGGTSFDVSVVRDGEVSYTRETWLDEVFTGHITGLSSVDVKNVGAGGGSIAWLDQGGLIRVGPHSAGAEPGPVCYSRGGTEPTVTDAAVVLGYIDPDYFLGGLLKLDVDGARDAVARQIAGPLGMSVERAAWAILAIANEHMVTAVRDITINQGIDPRESVLVAGGGAGGLTMTQIAAELDCDRVLVPRTAAALSACGGLFSDVVTEFVASQRADTGDFAFDDVNRVLAELEARMDEFFERLGVDEDVRVKEFSVEARYPFQIWELDVPLASSRFGERWGRAAPGRRLPRRSRADVRRQGAGSASRMPPLEGACDRPPAAARARGAVAERWRAAQAAHDAADLVGGGDAEGGGRIRRRRAASGPRAGGPGAGRAAHHDGGRLPRLVADRHRVRRVHADSSGLGTRDETERLRERHDEADDRSDPAGDHRQPLRQHLPRHDEHAAALGALGRHQPGA